MRRPTDAAPETEADPILAGERGEVEAADSSVSEAAIGSAAHDAPGLGAAAPPEASAESEAMPPEPRADEAASSPTMPEESDLTPPVPRAGETVFEADHEPTEAEIPAPLDLAAFDSQPPLLVSDADAAPAVGAPFATWMAAYGHALSGAPISGVLPMNGGSAQYFENLALFASSDGHVRPLPIGEAALRSATADATRDADVAAGWGPAATFPITDMTATLARHPSRRYRTRPLSQIRHLVIHHTGTSAPLTPVEIAKEHVEANGWPGIGYHFVIDARGVVTRTQDLTTETYHARQFNPAAVGVALAGDFTADVPPPGQIEATAFLLAELLRDLGLPPEAIRGHREMVATPCPGDAFLTLWKPRLVRLVEARLAAAES